MLWDHWQVRFLRNWKKKEKKESIHAYTLGTKSKIIDYKWWFSANTLTCPTYAYQNGPVYWGFQEETSTISSGLLLFYSSLLKSWIRVDVDQRYHLNFGFSWTAVIIIFNWQVSWSHLYYRKHKITRRKVLFKMQNKQNAIKPKNQGKHLILGFHVT